MSSLVPVLDFDKTWKTREFRNWDFAPALPVTDRSMIRHLHSGNAKIS